MINEIISFMHSILVRLDEVQEELLYYPRRRHWRWRCAVLFSRDVLDEIWDLTESVYKGFIPTFLSRQKHIKK